jgi:ectoine hydroxylase-related dioxygenase (phytanoyl-CoA dioxygenase family)
VRDNALPSGHFCKPTTKAGVPHVEAPRWLLDRMLTARIHLDDITDENGPLRIVPGSHRSGKEPLDVAAGDPRVRPILVSAGDVLLMRPLVVHASGNSRDGTWRHRRIVHLEFAADERLPDGYDWFDYRRLVVG